MRAIPAVRGVFRPLGGLVSGLGLKFWGRLVEDAPMAEMFWTCVFAAVLLAAVCRIFGVARRGADS